MAHPAGVEPASPRLEDGRLSIRATSAIRKPQCTGAVQTKLDASTGAAPAHCRFADGCVPVSPRRIREHFQEEWKPVFRSKMRSAKFGSPSRNRTEVGRFRAGHSSIELRGSDWSGCGVLPTGLRGPSAGLFLHELHPVNSGAHERIRTPIFSSCYGYPVRSRARLRARKWQGRRVSIPLRLIESQAS